MSSLLTAPQGDSVVKLFYFSLLNSFFVTTAPESRLPIGRGEANKKGLSHVTSLFLKSFI
jgi:hypothetical protein